MGLNVFASAYTLYSAMLSDLAIRDVLAAEKEDLVTVRDWLEKQRRYLGNVSQVDVDRADSEVKLAEANISAMDELLIRERAALREMLALDLDAKIILEPHHTPGFPAEDLTIPQLAGKIQAVAPENLQISFLEKAAEEARWGKSFGFLSGAGLNVGSSGSVSFSKLAGSAQFSIGFDYVPGIQLASDNIEAIRLRARELLIHQQALAEATLGSIWESKKQVASTTDAVAVLQGVFRTEFRRYTLGLTDLLHVLDAQKAVARATAAKVKAQADLDALRVTLHRELLNGEFSRIPGCRIRPEAEKKDRDWLGKIFRPREFEISLDEACMPASS